MSRIDDRSPCVIGVARHTWREDLDGTPEPLRMWAAMAREAAADSQARRDVISAIDDVGIVHCQSWQYDFSAHRLSDALGLQPGHRSESILAGTSPQRLLNAAAERMLRGESRLALVVGGEALATRKRLSTSGERPCWKFADPDPKPPVNAEEWFLPTELAHGVLPAWLTFALLDQARAANGGWQFGSYRRACAEVLERCSAVAAGNRHAWFQQRYSATQIAEPAPENRWVAGPYTKRMTAFMDVDMAAGILLATHAEADRLAVPPERRVYLRGWAFARDATHLAARAQLDSSAAMRVASHAALSQAGIGVDDVAVFDLYSCFPAALHFAADALGLSGNETRSLTATGGLPYHGGPSSNYMSHSIGHVVDALRYRPGEFGLVSGIGMHMTKHVYACYSTDPGPVTPPDYTALQCAAAQPDRRVIAISAAAPAQVCAAATVHSRDGERESLLAICEFANGSRAYARTTNPEVIAALDGLDWREQSIVLRLGPFGTNLLAPNSFSS